MFLTIHSPLIVNTVSFYLKIEASQSLFKEQLLYIIRDENISYMLHTAQDNVTSSAYVTQYIKKK